MSEHAPIAIVGAGSIGVAFVLVFARAGLSVRLYDPDPTMREQAPARLLERARGLAEFDLLEEPAEALLDRVRVCAALDEAVRDATLVQECAPERVEVKRAIFEDLQRLAPAQAIFASSSSALPASSFAAELNSRSRCLVTHPGNPPYLLPVIEIVPAPFTEAAVVERCCALYARAGLRPVRVNKEPIGFVFNRLQGAVLREAYCLVRDGVASVEDIDTVMRDGLGLRWSVIGPFETSDLNYRGGIAEHAQRMADAYARMGSERGQDDVWSEDMVADVQAQRRALLPLEDWEARVRWRDRELMHLARLRKQRQRARD